MKQNSEQINLKPACDCKVAADLRGLDSVLWTQEMIRIQCTFLSIVK